MMHYARYGHNEFYITLGYKGDMIKSFFADQLRLKGHLTVDFRGNQLQRVGEERSLDDDWIVHLIETGPETRTGGRLKQVLPFVGEERFMLTFGDGVSDVDLGRLLQFHESHGRTATVTTVQPPSRFGHVQFEGDAVARFVEKPANGASWISGGFFVLEPEVATYLEDNCDWSNEVMPSLAAHGELMGYRHDGFWQCMDTIQERSYLESLWSKQQAPWKTW
jgi:glucose-1-phosphate cytidylyltransferase